MKSALSQSELRQIGSRWQFIRGRWKSIKQLPFKRLCVCSLLYLDSCAFVYEKAKKSVKPGPARVRAYERKNTIYILKHIQHPQPMTASRFVCTSFAAFPFNPRCALRRPVQRTQCLKCWHFVNSQANNTYTHAAAPTFSSVNAHSFAQLEITMARMEKHPHTLFSLSLFLTTVWMNDDGDDIILPTLSCASVRFSSDYSNHLSLSLSFSPRVRIKRVVANFHLRPAVSSSVRWQIFVCRSWRPLWRFIVLLCRRCKCSQRTYALLCCCGFVAWTFSEHARIKSRLAAFVSPA